MRSCSRSPGESRSSARTPMQKTAWRASVCPWLCSRRRPPEAGWAVQHLAAGDHRPVRFEQLRGEGGGDGAEVEDPAVGRVQGRDPTGVGLELPQPVAVEAAQARDPVGPTPALELLQARDLVLVDRDYDLAAALVRDRVALAEGVHVAGPFHAQLPLQRPGYVVDAGVHHARVVAALLTGKLGLALEHAHARLWTAVG